MDEAAVASNLGIEYIQIPVAWTAPTQADFQAFISVMDAHSDRQVFVHCAANKRVSVFVYLYRIYQGTDEIVARRDLAKIWTPEPIWQDFIETISLRMRE